ncbi:MAG TPA: hypothetical protein VGS08_02165 [Candidatus Saccharimonadales bacterium]|nr:hypothetical protein [Candidatus Saccharimonadales bacterium]
MDNQPHRQLHQTPHDKEEDDYKAAANAAIDFNQYMPQLRHERRWLRRLIMWVAGIVIIAGLGIAAYALGSHMPSSSHSVTKKTENTSRAAVATATKQYTSVNQNLSFSYPADWTVTETTDQITATSPDLRLTSSSGQSVNGQAIMLVRDKNVPLSEFKAGNAVAIINSQIITYSAPAAGQRGSSYVSYLNFASSPTTGLDGVYITGNTGYQTGQAAPASDLTPIDPVISITFGRCNNSSCGGSTSPLTIRTSSWNDTALSKPLMTMLESFSISS